MSDIDQGQERYDRLQQLAADAGTAMGLPADHNRCQTWASLKLAHERLTERLIAGEDVAPSALVALSKTIDELLPLNGDALPTVKVEYVEHIVGICPKCKANIEDYRAPPPPKQSVVIDAEAVPVEPEQAR